MEGALKTKNTVYFLKSWCNGISTKMDNRCQTYEKIRMREKRTYLLLMMKTKHTTKWLWKLNRLTYSQMNKAGHNKTILQVLF